MTAKVLVALLAVGLGGSCKRSLGELQFVDVKREDLVVGVVVTGELEAVDSTDVKPPPLDIWEWKIAMLATEGAEIKVGEPAVGFDTAGQARELETMQNEVDAAQKQLEKKRNDAQLARREEELAIAGAEATLRKSSLKATSPDDLVATIERKTTELDEKAAKIALEQAKNKAARQRRSDDAEIAQLTQQRLYSVHRAEEFEHNIASMTVTAARAGTVVYPTNQWTQEKKKVGDGSWRGEVVLQIVGLGKMFAKGQVDEVDIARVMPKQVVTLRLDALPDVQLKGHVDSIAKTVQAKSQADPSKVISIKITLDDTTAPLRPGMRFRGEVETERTAGVVQVPVDAVFVTADGPVAYRETSGGIEKVKVELGHRSATLVEVKTGLRPGDRVSRTDPDRSRK